MKDSAASSLRRLDPRLYQIGSLAVLLLYGTAVLRLDVTAFRIALLLSTALATQFACTWVWKLPRFDPKSALISGLSLCLLLRTNSAVVAAAAAGFAVASKFLLRWNGKHVFNPTNIGLVGAMLATGAVWISPAQWGSAGFLGFLVACLGGLVVTRAARADVTLAFLLPYVALVFGRSLALAEPMAIPFHRLQSGGLLIFAFFMISDPKTTPDSRAGRILFGALVAVGAAYVQFRLFRPNGPLWSLALASLLVPALDLVLPARRYAWNDAAHLTKGEPYVSLGKIEPLLPARVSRSPVAPTRPGVLRVLRGEGGREAP